MPKDALSLKRLLSARRARVFQAWTRPELMARWFFPAPGWTVSVSSDLRVGGRYEVRMLDAEGVLHLQYGEYREIVPDTRLVFTWSCPELLVEESVVTVELTDRGESTELRLTHELPADPNIRREHEEGWNGCFASLERMLADQRKESDMASIKDEIRIGTTASKAYDALTRE